MKPTREQLTELYDCVFTNVHSDGFKVSEMTDLIYDTEYRFLERPKENWNFLLREKLNSMGYDLDTLRANL